MSSIGDIGARAVLRKRQLTKPQTSSQDTGKGNIVRSRFRSAALAVAATSIDGKRFLKTDNELAKILTKPKDKKDKKDSMWLERMKRVHARKFGTYLFDKNNEYEFSKPKNQEPHELFFEGGNKYKKMKHMTKDEKLRMFKFFGKVVHIECLA